MLFNNKKGGWIEWTGGLVLFNILLTVLVIGAGMSGEDISSADPYGMIDQATINESVMDSSPAKGFFGTIWNICVAYINGFLNMPWWVSLFIGTFNIALVIILVITLLRGLN